MKKEKGDEAAEIKNEIADRLEPTEQGTRASCLKMHQPELGKFPGFEEQVFLETTSSNPHS